MHRSKHSLLVGTLACSWLLLAGALPAAEAPIEFNRDIRPILAEHCFLCHGPDQNKRQGDMRLDTQEGLLGKDGQPGAVVPGKAEVSELVKRITSKDPEERMPPAKDGKPLTAQQIATLQRWVAEGAKWQGHWAYLAPARAAVPQVTAPADRPNFLKNDVDRFILQRLAVAKLSPAPEADRATLIRRLSLDLLGLPPSAEEVAAFINDKRPDAYEQLVERLLASPHFGERMAVAWLDLVRFADTIGYHSDNPRDIVPYRDYVIEAFNQNRPFDQFTIEQLAGDLLPNPTLTQRVGSGYNRLLQTTEEGGAQGKEYAAKYLADRVRNVGSVWLGGTIGCAECHDHKYDPYSTRDFYSLASFFADVREAPVGRREAGMPVLKPEQMSQQQKLEAQIAAAKKTLATSTPELVALQQKWEQELAAITPLEWKALTPAKAESAGGAKLNIDPAGFVLVNGKGADKDTYTLEFTGSLAEVTALRIDALTEKSLPKQGPGRSGEGKFVVTALELRTGGEKTPPRSFTSAVTTRGAAGAETLVVAPTKDPKAKPKPGAWSNHAAGTEDVLLVELAPPVSDLEQALEGKADEGKDQPRFTLVIRQDVGKAQTLGRFRISTTTAPRPVKLTLRDEVPAGMLAIVTMEAAKRTPQQTTDLAAYYRSIAPPLNPVRASLSHDEQQLAAVLNAAPKTLVSMAQGPAMVRILPRGNWLDDSGQPVTPAIPAFLGKLEIEGRRPTRLDLAQWLVAPGNPLTSRVFVNRLWKMYFGTGLSKSLEDLGSQGEWPTHPELLDWLAVDFRERNWDVKQLVRLLVTSGTYRQSSQQTRPARAVDPFNRLLSAQSRYRIDAEFVRDNALAISGLLVRRVGGESVKPYQPDGYWDYLNFPRRNWQADAGEDQHRRGLYTHWQRSFLHPSLLAFDAPSREECTAERTRSNIPQQALVLLNDPTYVEAARVFGAKIVAEGGATPAERITWAYRRALARDPLPAEVKLLEDLAARHQTQFAQDRAAAEKLLKTGQAPPAKVDAAEAAAWTSVARAILNLHETITRL